MNVSVIVATCGEDKWADLAYERAVPSAAAEARGGPVDRFMFVQHHRDLTVAQARNRAAEHCSFFDWLCFLDADDELEPGYLDAMDAAYRSYLWPAARSAQEPLVAPPLFVPAVRNIPSGFRPGLAESPRFPAGIPNKGRWPRTNECVIGTLVQRGLFMEVGGFRDTTDDGTPITLYEDWDLWLRCTDAGAERVYVEAAVYRAHVNHGGGRNVSADSQAVYDAIWADHVARTEATRV